MMRPAFAVVLAVLVALAAAPAAEAKWGFGDALTERGKIVEDLFGIILILGVVVFLIVFVWLVLLVWRFREGTGHGRATNEKHRHSTKAEVAWFGVPLLMVLYIGYISYGGLIELDHGIRPEDTELQVRVSASQWNWEFDYGSGVKVNADPDTQVVDGPPGNTFLVPADTNILFNITGNDVIHAFQVIDANRGFVMFHDANPLGENKYTLQGVNLPGGEYKIICNKMCLNAGHAYMRGRIQAVPEAEFDHWLFGKKAEAGAALVQKVSLESRPDGLHYASNGTLLSGSLTVAAETRVVVDLVDTLTAVTLKVPGVAEKTILAGTEADTYFAFDAEQEGTYTLTGSNGGSLTVVAIAAIPKTIEMGAFVFDPTTLALEVGKTYLVTVPNLHTATHDLHIGTYKGGSGDVVVARSPSVAGGGSSAFLVTPTQAGTFDLWCSQAGHVAQGMVNLGGVTITA